MQARRTGRKNIGSAKQSRADEHLSFRDTADLGTPSPRGLYDPALEKDSCGVGFIADLKGRKSHKIIDDGLTILLNLEHRGAVGADPRMGDGAGILVQIPHKFFVKEAARIGFKLPKPGEYAVGYLFMPQDSNWRQIIRDVYAEVGALCRPTTRRSVNQSSQPSPSTCKCLSVAARKNFPRTSSNGGCTFCASQFPTRSTAHANVALQAITRYRSPAAR
jgi:hypothetical protein